MSPTNDSLRDALPKSFDVRIVVAVWLSLFVYGVVAAPIPAVNEPHYLCKAKYFWQPDWCPNDFFLTSPNAHTVFYITVGWLTQWLSLAQTACVGRALATLVLAVGWTSLTTRLLSQRWSPLAACWLFLALASCGNFSGEWLVGGVEGKVFSYGFLFASFGQKLRERIVLSGALAGLAIAFHPVVGMWGALAFAGARMMKRGATSHAAVRSALAIGVLIVLALPGLIPVIRLLAEPVPAATNYSATYIQVYYRLAHHLDPMMFPLRAYAGYALLLVLWGISLQARDRSDAQRMFDRVVMWSFVFLAIGLLIGAGPRPPKMMPYFMERAQLLKFYPFRLADVMLPLSVSVGALRWIEARRAIARSATSSRQSASSVGWLAGFALLFVAALGRAHFGRETNRYAGELRSDWLDACRWIDAHLPADAAVQAPHNGWAFKWFAGRAEYVAFKDCPQDAAGIVEWNRRLLFLKKWYEDQYADDFYSADELRALRRATGITHLLTDRLGPLALEPIYRNGTFQVYDLTTLDR